MVRVYVGSTCDPGRREKQHRACHRTIRHWKILASNLTYGEAQRREQEELNRGQRPKWGIRRVSPSGHAGGPPAKDPDATYVVYRFETD